MSHSCSCLRFELRLNPNPHRLEADELFGSKRSPASLKRMMTGANCLMQSIRRQKVVPRFPIMIIRTFHVLESEGNGTHCIQWALEGNHGYEANRKTGNRR